MRYAGTVTYACARQQTSTATMRETMDGMWPIGFVARGVDPWSTAPQRLTGVVTLGAGSAASRGAIEAVPTGARPCTGMRSTFDDRLTWARGAEVTAAFQVTAPGVTGGSWTIGVDAPDTASLFSKAGAAVTTTVKAGAAPGDCPGTATTHTQPFTPARGFALPAITVDIACRPVVRIDLALVPAMSFSVMALQTGRNVADCSTRVADLAVALVRRF